MWLAKVSILWSWWTAMVRESVTGIHYAFPLCSKQNSAFCSIHADFVFVWLCEESVVCTMCCKTETHQHANTKAAWAIVCLLSPAGLWTHKPKQFAQTSFFVGTINVLSSIWFALISLSHQRYKHRCLGAVRSRCFSLCMKEELSYGEIEMFLRRATCHEGRKNYMYWFMLLILIYFVCLK